VDPSLLLDALKAWIQVCEEHVVHHNNSIVVEGEVGAEVEVKVGAKVEPDPGANRRDGLQVELGLFSRLTLPLPFIRKATYPSRSLERSKRGSGARDPQSFEIELTPVESGFILPIALTLVSQAMNIIPTVRLPLPAPLNG
jgi:hypothetical protein